MNLSGPLPGIPIPPWGRGWRRIAVAATILGVLGWRSLNYAADRRPIWDSGIFASVAYHLNGGRALYRDVWDHKPPLIYFLNAWALRLGDGTINAVRQMERGFGAAAALAIFWVAFRLWGRVWLAVVGALFFLAHFFSEKVHFGGNLSEIYGSVFALGGMGCAIEGRRRMGRVSLGLGALCGGLFSLATWTKEPFLFSSVAWFFYLVTGSGGAIRHRNLLVVTFLAGALAPALAFILYFVLTGTLVDWLAVLDYNSRYSSEFIHRSGFFGQLGRNLAGAWEKFFSLTRLGPVAAGAGAAAAVLPGFNRRYDRAPAFLLIGFALEFYATTISGLGFGHYYLQFCAVYTLIAAGALAALADGLERLAPARSPAIGRVGSTVVSEPPARAPQDWKGLLRWTFRREGAILVLVLGGWVLVDRAAVVGYLEGARRAARTVGVGPIAEAIARGSGPSEPIWAVSAADARVYVEAARYSPTPYFFTLGHIIEIETFRESAESKIERIQRDLQTHPPRFIVVSEQFPYLLKLLNIEEFLQKEYAPTGVYEIHSNGARSDLYARREAPP